VPDEIEGFTVEVKEKTTPPPGPSVLMGVVRSIGKATPEEAAEGLAGTVTIEGELYMEGAASSSFRPRRLTVRIPKDITIWCPMGEARDFIHLADVRVGDDCRAGAQTYPAPAATDDPVPTSATYRGRTPAETQRCAAITSRANARARSSSP